MLKAFMQASQWTRSIATLFAFCMIFTACVGHTHAAVILNENFDSYTNTANFSSVWTPIGSDGTAPGGLLSTTQSASGPNSIYVPGTLSNNQYRNRQSFSETSAFSTGGNLGIGDILVWSFDFYDAQSPLGNPQRNYANLQDTTAPTGTNQIVAMGLNNNRFAIDDGGNYYMARILGYTPPGLGNGVFFKLNDAGAPLRSAGWNNLKVEISTDDEINTDYRFYVNNTLAKTILGVGNASQIRSYDNITIGSGLANNSVEAYFDNMYLEYQPAAPPAVATWINAAGGAFSTASNWQDNKRPGAITQTVFNLPNTYTITLNQNTTNYDLIPQNGNVTFDLQSNTYSLGHYLLIGGPQSASLKLLNGDVTAQYAKLSSLGTAQLTLENANLTTDGAGVFDVGVGGGHGAVLVTGDSLLRAEYMRIGENSGSNGLVEIVGANARAEVEGMQIGATGTGRLEIRSGGQLHSTLPVALGNFGSTAQGEVLVTGAGSSLDIDQALFIADDGSGTLQITNAGVVESDRGFIAHLVGSTGTVQVNGAGSLWNVSRSLYVGGSEGAVGGAGSLSVSNNGQVYVGQTLHVWADKTVDVSNDGVINVGSGDSPSLGTVRVGCGGKLSGTGMVVGNTLVDGGRVAPGNSPGILHIDGDYTQTATSVLEIEVGGLTPGTQHDQVQITGSAALSGRLEVPIINGFVPALNDEVTFLTAVGGVSGDFRAIHSPGLAAANPNLAIKVVKEPTVNPTEFRIQFVVPKTDIAFDSTDTTPDWSDPDTWQTDPLSTSEVPESQNIIDIGNLAGTPQRVNVQTADAYTHQLSIASSTDTITIGVKNGQSLSAVVGATIGDNAVIELGQAGMPTDTGVLASDTVAVQGGGRLSGNGTVAGDLVIGTASGTQQATLSPGFSVGHLDVDGNYTQAARGTLVIDVEGAGVDEFDTIDVTGQLNLGGTLKVDASQFAGLTAGATVDILKAESIAPDTIFDQVLTIGSGDYYFAPSYLPGVVQMTSYIRGDMNRNLALDVGDITEFALALRNPDAYYNLRFIEGSQSGNMDGQGGLDFDDINPFAVIMQNAGMANARALLTMQLAGVPEPSTIAFCIMGFLCSSILRRRVET